MEQNVPRPPVISGHLGQGLHVGEENKVCREDLEVSESQDEHRPLAQQNLVLEERVLEVWLGPQIPSSTGLLPSRTFPDELSTSQRQVHCVSGAWT